MCGKDYNTFSHLSKYCDKCKDFIAEETKDWWRTWVDESITSEDVISWGYSSMLSKSSSKQLQLMQAQSTIL
jgi:hypothetical protein